MKKRYFAHITKVSETSCVDEIAIWRDTSLSPNNTDYRARLTNEEDLANYSAKDFVSHKTNCIKPNQMFDVQVPVISEDTWIEMPSASVYSRSLCGFKPCKWFINFDLYSVGFFGMRKIATYEGISEELSTWEKEKAYYNSMIEGSK